MIGPFTRSPRLRGILLPIAGIPLLGEATGVPRKKLSRTRPVVCLHFHVNRPSLPFSHQHAPPHLIVCPVCQRGSAHVIGIAEIPCLRRLHAQWPGRQKQNQRQSVPWTHLNSLCGNNPHRRIESNSDCPYFGDWLTPYRTSITTGRVCSWIGQFPDREASAGFHIK